MSCKEFVSLKGSEKVVISLKGIDVLIKCTDSEILELVCHSHNSILCAGTTNVTTDELTERKFVH